MNVQNVSVTGLNNRIKGLLEADLFLNDVKVEGELSNYKIYPSGHHYFTLKDSESSIKAVMFKGSAMKLKFKPESGMKVIVRGRVSVYPRDGAYQLYCTELAPDGVGDLQFAYEQLKEKLEKEGLFDRQYKKEIPKFPKTIAIITSSAGAAIHDMIRVLRARYPLAKVKLLAVRVQGIEAPPEIVGAIRYANRYKVADVIITGRGGGSIEDLWAFNDERVARAIFDSEIPIISAVGHEPDVTIADFVADLRAATPSNAAELAVPNMADLRESLMSFDIRNLQAVTKKLSHNQQVLDDIKSRRVMKSPSGFIDERSMELDNLSIMLTKNMENKIMRLEQSFGAQAAKLDALSPLKVLGRGYSIAKTAEGKILREVADVEIGDDINLSLKDGTLNCKVIERVEDR